MEGDGLSWANMGVNGTGAPKTQFRWIRLTGLKLKERLRNPLSLGASLSVMVNPARLLSQRCGGATHAGYLALAAGSRPKSA
jgi:hypothetical protein